MSEPDPDVDSLEKVLFGSLELPIRRRSGQARTNTADDFQIVVPPATGPVRSVTDHEIVSANSLETLLELDIPELLPLARRLTGAPDGWTGWARVTRVYQAGVGARLRLEGGRKVSSLPLPGLRNSYYIVLRAPDLENGCWTRNYSSYVVVVRDGSLQAGNFDRDSASHSFPSQAEADAYLLGTRRQWPPFR